MYWPLLVPWLAICATAKGHQGVLTITATQTQYLPIAELINRGSGDQCYCTELGMSRERDKAPGEEDEKWEVG